MLAARLLQSAVVKARSARSDSGRLAAAQTWLLQAHLSAPTLLTMASQLSARAALAPLGATYTSATVALRSARSIPGAAAQQLLEGASHRAAARVATRASHDVGRRLQAVRCACGAPRVVLAASSKGKRKTKYVCEECGQEHVQWQGKCSGCGAWNTLVEKVEVEFTKSGGGGAANRLMGRLQQGEERAKAPWGSGATARKRSGGVAAQEALDGRRKSWLDGDESRTRPMRMSEVASLGQTKRLRIGGHEGIEIERVLGGGVMPGSLILVGGDPGVGKSTLLLQVAARLAESNKDNERGVGDGVMYISGEESAQQVLSRALRLGLAPEQLEDIVMYGETDVDKILEHLMDIGPRAVIVDSIQTMFLAEATGSPGSVSQVRECATAFLRVAKSMKVPIFLVGHVTKQGDFAGPRTLEHIVDVSLYLQGERLSSMRVLRSEKNRFGPTDEVGIFDMQDEGMTAVQDPSKLMLDNYEELKEKGSTGSIAVVLQGTRPMLLEVQALCSLAHDRSGVGRLSVTGAERHRVDQLIAIMDKHLRVGSFRFDKFVSIVGGLRLQEPAGDVAIAMALLSSMTSRPIRESTAFIGEVGLYGEIRPVQQLSRRVGEVRQLGFKQCVIPRMKARGGKRGASLQSSSDFRVIECDSLKDAMRLTLGPKVSKENKSDDSYETDE